MMRCWKLSVATISIRVLLVATWMCARSAMTLIHITYDDNIRYSCLPIFFARAHRPIMVAPAQNCFVDSDLSAESVASITRALALLVCARTFRMTRTTVRGQRRRAETKVSRNRNYRIYVSSSEGPCSTYSRPLRIGSIARFGFDAELACPPGLENAIYVAILTIFQLYANATDETPMPSAPVWHRITRARQV